MSEPQGEGEEMSAQPTEAPAGMKAKPGAPTGIEPTAAAEPPSDCWDDSDRWYPAGYHAPSDVTNAGRALRVRSVGDPGDFQFIAMGHDNQSDAEPPAGAPPRGWGAGRLQWMWNTDAAPTEWNNGNGADGARVEQYVRRLDDHAGEWHVDVTIAGYLPLEPVAGLCVTAEDGICRVYLKRRDGSRHLIASETDGGWSAPSSYGYPAGWQYAGAPRCASGRLQFASPPGAAFEAWVDDRGVPYEVVTERPPEESWQQGPPADQYTQPVEYP
jgi:hypothetical protein